MIAGRYDEAGSKAADLVARVGEKPFSTEVEEEAKREVAACLRATKRVRERNPDGDIIYVDIPDRVLRAAVGLKIIEHNIGRPLVRTVTANLTPPGAPGSGGTSEDLLKLLLADTDTAADIVGKLKSAAEKAKKALPVDVTATESLPKPPPSSV